MTFIGCLKFTSDITVEVNFIGNLFIYYYDLDDEDTLAKSDRIHEPY